MDRTVKADRQVTMISTDILKTSAMVKYSFGLLLLCLSRRQSLVRYWSRLLPLQTSLARLTIVEFLYDKHPNGGDTSCRTDPDKARSICPELSFDGRGFNRLNLASALCLPTSLELQKNASESA